MKPGAIVAVAGLAALAVGGGAGYFYLQSGKDRFAECRATNVSGGAGLIGGPFELVDHTGRSVTDADVITKPSILYFGYTFCPDVCPIDVDRNVIAVELVQDRGLDIQPVFVSIDPGRDTPEVLAAYAANMHDDMIGLTGSDDQVRAASRAYRTFFQRHDTEDDEFYLVDHSTQSYFVLPGHGTVEVYNRALAPDAMAASMACFIEKS
jgi:protein SCO1/2